MEICLGLLINVILCVYVGHFVSGVHCGEVTSRIMENQSESNVINLQQLIEKLYEIYEKDEVDQDMVMGLFRCLKSDPREWQKYANFNRFGYTRNLVDGGNGKFNLMLLCWGEGQVSKIHDHAGADCFMKVMQGSLTEVRYTYPVEYRMRHVLNGCRALQEIGRNTLQLNDVCFINDYFGVHQVENASHTAIAVSLHLYSPPFNECIVFNEKNGKLSKCKVTFWSRYGVKASESERNSCFAEVDEQ